MPFRNFVNGVYHQMRGGDARTNARLMDQYARMAERGINVERERQSVLEGMNRLERERLQIASRNFDRLRESTAQIRQQNQMLRESYSTTGLQARAMERVADIHRGITQELSLERVLTRALGAAWEQQVGRGAKIAAKIIADIPNDVNEARLQVDRVTAGFRTLYNETNRLAMDYNENFAEVMDLQNRHLQNMTFTADEIDRGARGLEGTVTNLNRSYAALMRMGMAAQDLEETLNFADEAAQMGHSYTETTGALAVQLKMVERLAKTMRKGPNAELNQFDHILRDKVLKSVRKLFTEFGGINTSVERLTALMLTAGQRAQQMGATMAEAGEVGQRVGNFFTNTRGRGDDNNFMEGEEMRVRLGLARYVGRGASRRAVENRQQVRDATTGRMRAENDDEIVNRVLAANPQLYGASVTDEQRRSRLRRVIRAGSGDQQMTANIMATEEFGGTQVGVESIAETLRSLINGERGGGGPNINPATQTEMIMERFGLTGRMQASMVQEMIANRDFNGLQTMISQARKDAGTSEEATDPVRQGQAIQGTFQGVQSLVQLQNVANRTLEQNMTNLVENVTRMGAAFLPGGMIWRLAAHVTGDTSVENRANAPRTQAAANEAAVAAGSVSAGVVTGEIDSRTNAAMVQQGIGTASANLSYGATVAQIERDRARGRGEGESGVMVDIERNLKRIQNGSGWERARGVGSLLARATPLGVVASLNQAVLGGGYDAVADAAAQASESGGVQAQATTQVLREFQTTYRDSDATARLSQALNRASSQSERERILQQAVEEQRRRITAPATVPGGTPTPTAPPSAQQAAQTQNARQASLGTTAAGASGPAIDMSLEPAANGTVQATARFNITGMPNVVASQLADYQRNALQG